MREDKRAATSLLERQQKTIENDDQGTRFSSSLDVWGLHTTWGISPIGEPTTGETLCERLPYRRRSGRAHADSGHQRVPKTGPPSLISDGGGAPNVGENC